LNTVVSEDGLGHALAWSDSGVCNIGAYNSVALEVTASRNTQTVWRVYASDEDGLGVKLLILQ
jgi:hypothetical protein